MTVKYPRTFHHPTSPGVQSDDKILHDLGAFEGAEIVVTEKMDGENTSLYTDGFHARSLDTGYHPSRDWLAGFHATIAFRIPPGWRICGENLYARHSVVYTDLPSYFLGFSAWNVANDCLSWDDTLAFFAQIGVTPVRQVFRGRFSPTLLGELGAALDTDRQEGLVMRLAGSFPYTAFPQSVVKWVRRGHVQSDRHWSKGPLVANELERESTG